MRKEWKSTTGILTKQGNDFLITCNNKNSDSFAYVEAATNLTVTDMLTGS